MMVAPRTPGPAYANLQGRKPREWLKFSCSLQIALKLSRLMHQMASCRMWVLRGSTKRRGKTNVRSDHCELERQGRIRMWLNPEGRDIVVKELQGLSETNDHFHFGPKTFSEVEVANRPYRSDDKLLMRGKILLRTDAWDAEFFPHVLDINTFRMREAAWIER